MGPNQSCGLVDVGCQVGNAVSNGLVDMAKSFAAGAADIAAQAATFWVNIPTPDVTPANPAVAFIQGSLYWYMGALAVASVMIGAIRIMMEQRLTAAHELAKSLGRLVLINGAGLTALAGLIYAADAFAKWIIDRSTKNFGHDLTAALGIQNANVNLQTAMIILLIAFLGAVASLLQIALMVVRNGFLLVMAGVWPTTASFTNTEMGMAWFKRSTAWLIAYLLYKPVSAIIYATAFQSGANLGQGGGNPVVNAVVALTLMFMSLLALPALLRFTAPVLESVTGRGGGAVSGLAVALPTGAAMLRGGGPSGAALAGATRGMSGMAGPTGHAGPSVPAMAGSGRTSGGNGTPPPPPPRTPRTS